MSQSQIQQGDVLIRRIEALPGGCKPVARENGRLVLMKGELTGHHHAIRDGGAKLWELNSELFLEVTEPVVVTHDEHKPLPIPEGIYLIGQVQEFDYFSGMERPIPD